MIQVIPEYIKHLPATDEPLSADVYIVSGRENDYIFDVGNNAEALEFIAQAAGNGVVILSHPHNDHVGNIEKLAYRALYVGDKTREKLGGGTVVEDALTIGDGVTLEIRHCPSPHTDGSLILTVNGEYTLLADLYFTKPDYDRKKAHQMLDALKELETKYFVVSHQKAACVFEKAALIEELEDYFK